MDPQPLPPAARALTQIQRTILDFIINYVAERGFPPSVRDISAAVGKQVTTVHYHLRELEWKGRLVRAPNIPRGIRVIHLEAVEET